MCFFDLTHHRTTNEQSRYESFHMAEFGKANEWWMVFGIWRGLALFVYIRRQRYLTRKVNWNLESGASKVEIKQPKDAIFSHKLPPTPSTWLLILVIFHRANGRWLFSACLFLCIRYMAIRGVFNIRDQFWIWKFCDKLRSWLMDDYHQGLR